VPRVSLRTRFLLYLVAIHVVFGAAVAVLAGHQRLWLLGLEALLLASLLAGVRLIRQLTRPHEITRQALSQIESGDFTTRFIEEGPPDVERLMRVYNEMTERLRRERILNREQDSLLKRLMQLSPSGMISLDFDGNAVEMNPAAAALLGRPAAAFLGTAPAAWGDPLGAELALLTDGESRLVTLAGRRRLRCLKLPYIDRGFARSFILIDELTRELYESEKAAYEKLIRTMSHEINNTSASVISLLQSCLDDPRGGGPEAGGSGAPPVSPAADDHWRESLTVAINRTSHMNAFLRRFADVIRLPAPHREPCDINEMLAETARALKPQTDARNIRWRWELAGNFPRVSADRAQLEQVFLNVAKNAMEAIGRDGEIVVRTRMDGSGPAGQAGGAARFIEIEDTGGGIAPEVHDKLFTPFFTSKPGGNGIGLTLIREILESHGFDGTLENAGAGRAVFRVRV
jgi:two-component system nitrogen regulation sensor histidine kinase NtrY